MFIGPPFFPFFLWGKILEKAFGEFRSLAYSRGVRMGTIPGYEREDIERTKRVAEGSGVYFRREGNGAVENVLGLKRWWSRFEHLVQVSADVRKGRRECV